MWFTQRNAQSSAVPAAVTSAEEFDGLINVRQAVPAVVQNQKGEPVTVMLSSKNISQPIFSTRRVAEASGTSALTSDPGPVQTQTSPPAGASASAHLWVLSGSKSFSEASTVVSGQLRRAVTPPPTVMTSSKSGVIELITAEAVMAANGTEAIQVNTEPRLGNPLPPLTQRPPPPTPRHPPSVDRVLLPSTKVAPVLKPQYGMGAPSQTESAGRNIGSWGFLPPLSWDLRAALQQFEFQMKKSLGVESAPQSPPPVMMPGSKSLRLMPLSPPAAAGGGGPALSDPDPAKSQPVSPP